MVHLTCLCLCIRIHVQEPIFDHSFDSEDSDGLEDVEDPFLCSEHISLVNLGLGGITNEHDYLCSVRTVGQWVIHKCGICLMDAYAIKSKHSNQILVNLSLEGDETRINFLKSSPNYSQVFGVVLPQGRLLAASLLRKTSSAGKHLNLECNNAQAEAGSLTIKNKMSRYLLEQQSAMEERIRTFTEKQHSEFAQLQLKVGREKDVLVTILAESEIAEECKLSQESSARYGKAEESRPLETRANVDTKTETSADSRRLNGSGRNKVHSVPCVAFGGVFEMEGLDTEDQDQDEDPFDESDEAEACYNSSDDDRRNNLLRAEDAMKQYATSLPIQVPAWQNLHDAKNKALLEEKNFIQQTKTFLNDQKNHPSKTAIQEESGTKEERIVTEDPGNIAESIQQMVTQPSTEVFGALPRRRLNTGDLVRSRLRFRRQEE